MKVIPIACIVFLQAFDTQAQVNTQVLVEFELDGRTVEFSEMRSIALFVINDENGTHTVMKPAIDSNSFLLPSHMKQNCEYTIVARYNSRYMALGRHSFESLQSPKWVVGLDMKPINQSYPIDSSVVAETKGVVYIKLFPADHGEGYVVMQTINQPRVFFSDSKRITCPR